MSGSIEECFSGTKAAQIVGITYRQLDYWARTDLVRPTVADASGSGTRRQYSYRDLLELRMIKNLLDAGIKLESVREVFTYLRNSMHTDIAAAHLVISGNQVVLCDGDSWIDLVRKGQGVLNVLPLASVKDEIDSALVELRPGREFADAEVATMTRAAGD
jgi:DNA-binding transcriptional MerR regulator